MIPMPERPSRQVRSAEEFPASLGQRLGAQFGGAWEDNPAPLFNRWNELSRAQRRQGSLIPTADAAAVVEREGVSLKLPEGGVSAEALDIMIERAKKRQAREDVINRGPQGAGPATLGFLTELGAGLLDPIGFGLNFVPVVGQGTRLGMMANSTRLGTRLLGRTGVGAIEGAVGQAIVEPAVGYVSLMEGQEYGLGNAVTNIAMGGALGGVAHNIVGGVGDAWKAWGPKKEEAPGLPGTTPVMPEVAEVMDQLQATDALAAAGSIYGANTRVKVGDAYQPARWAVVDAEELAPTLEKADNQFRDRTRAASDAQVRSIATNMDFEYLAQHPDMSSGAPTLSKDGQIIGGNGRTAAISLAYDLPTRALYEGPLKERLSEFGINPAAVRGMKKPMLVRVLQGDVDVRAAAIASNETGTLRMSALEQAKVDGERLGRTDLAASEDGRLDTAENRGAIRRWVEQFPESERAALIDRNGALSVEGVQRLRNAALYQAYGDTPVLARLVEATDPGLGRVSAALVRAAGKIAEVRAAAARGELHPLDIGDDLVAAVSKLADLRQKGMSVEEFLGQADMFGMDLTPEGVRLLSFLGRNMDSSRRMADGITRFYDAVEQAGDPSQGSLFGPAEAPDRGVLLEQALRAAEEFAGTAEAKLEKVSPATRDAALGVAASQLMDGRDIEVQALVDADPAIGTATADDLIAAADRADRVEAHRTVDMAAAAEVAQRVAEAPKTWGAETAKADRDRVAADLEVLFNDQENAWKYARAYHGTPHIFAPDERGQFGGFRWDKMGTGEGAQAFGYGHYMAQNEKIARERYRDRLVDFNRAEAVKRAVALFVNEREALSRFDMIWPEVPQDVREYTLKALSSIKNKAETRTQWRDVKNKFIESGLMGDDDFLGDEKFNRLWDRLLSTLLQIGPNDGPAWKFGDRVSHWRMDGPERYIARAIIEIEQLGYAGAKADAVRTRNEYIENLNQYKRELEELENVSADKRDEKRISQKRDQINFVENYSIAELDAIIALADELTVPDDYSPFPGAIVVSPNEPWVNASPELRDVLDKVAPGLGEMLDMHSDASAEPITMMDVRRNLQTLVEDSGLEEVLLDPDAWAAGLEQIRQDYGNRADQVIAAIEDGTAGRLVTGAMADAMLAHAGIFLHTPERKLRPDIERIEPKPAEVSPGSVYTIEIPDELEANFLQWDAPFDEQPAKVRDAFETIAPGFTDIFADQPREFTGERAYRTLASVIKDDFMEQIDPAVANDAFMELSRRRGKEYADGFMNKAMEGDLDRSEAEELLSIMLSQQGVHGQKFLDGNSRRLWTGNSRARFNYVIFDDETASLVARYMAGMGSEMGPPMTAAELTTMARAAFGVGTEALMKAGNIEVVDRVADLPPHPAGIAHPADVSGMTAPDGRVYLVAENSTPAMVRGLLLHEVGVHVGMERMLGPQGFERVLSRVDELLKLDDDAVRMARQAVPSNTEPSLVREETLAYLVQNIEEMKAEAKTPGVRERIQQIFDEIVAAVRAWAYKTFEGLQDRMELTTADIQALAVSALRQVAREAEARRVDGAMPPRYSRGQVPVPPRDALAAFKEAEARAAKYAAAVRAAASRIGDDQAMRAAIEAAGGGELVGREVEELIDLLKTRHGEIVRGLRKSAQAIGAADAAIDMNDAALRAAAEIADQQERAAAVEHRNAMLSLAAKTKAVSYVLSQFKGREIDGVRAMLGGTALVREGGRRSVEMEQRQTLGKWLGAMEGELRKAGVWEMWVKDAYPRDVARALWQLSTEAPDMAGLPKEAVQIAEIVHKYQTDAKIQQNKLGAWIGDLQGWMFRQGHDPDKLRGAGFEAWREFVEPRLDWGRMAERMDIGDHQQYLRRVFENLADGIHNKAQSIEVVAPSVGPGNLAKKASQSRDLLFRDADAGYEYMQKFGPGQGSLCETVLKDFGSAARNVGLMRVLGPNYEGNLEQVMDHIEDSLIGAPGKARERFRAKRAEVLDLLHHVDGSLSIPHSKLGAKIGAGLRAWQSLKLGAALLSQISDIPVFGANIAHRFETGLGTGLMDALSGLLQGRASGDRLEVLHECAYFYDSLTKQAMARFDVSDVPGFMSTFIEQYFKWSGMTWWGETMRSSAVLTISRRLADFRSKALVDLPKSTREMLSLYRIDAGKWDLMRMASTKEADGEVYLTPEGFRTVSDAAFAGYLESVGRPTTPAAVAALRDELADAYRVLLIDQSAYSALEPGANTRQFLLRGTRPGTIPGDLLRMFAQFKSFPVVYIERVFGREIYGRGYESLGDYFTRGKSHFAGLLGLMVAMTVAGFISMQAKQLLKLREPRPVTGPHWWRTWLAAFFQGGAGGIYGDFLFGQMSRVGTGAIEALAGPVPSTLFGKNGLYSLASDTMWGPATSIMSGEDVEPKDIASKWVNFVKNNSPLNLHILRPTMDALIFWRLQEALNPGSLRRMERKLEEETGSRYLVRPSELVR